MGQTMQGHRKAAYAVMWGREEGALGHRWGDGKEVRVSQWGCADGGCGPERRVRRMGQR